MLSIFGGINSLMQPFHIQRTWSLVGLAVLAVALSCSTSATSTSLPQGPEASAIVAASEFIVGEDRFPFGLVSRDGTLLENAEVQVRFHYSKEGSNESKGEATARFHQIEGVTPHRHADGQIHGHDEVRGLYVAGGVEFDAPGVWGAEFLAKTDAGRQVKVQGAIFEVRTESAVPYVGEPVPPSQNLTLAEVENIEEIETRVPPDGMHELSVAQALELGNPFVVVFATPMFCVTRMCGPVTDIAADLHGRFRDQVNFIHIEPWDLQIARSDGRLVPTDIAREWNLPTEPWVFVVNDEGKVAARFEGLVTSEELAGAITALLQ